MPDSPAGVLLQSTVSILNIFPFGLTNFHMTDYLLNCFNYIHQNPIKANLVSQLDDWPYSSWPDYYKGREGSLCNMEKALELIGVSWQNLSATENFVFNETILKELW